MKNLILLVLVLISSNIFSQFWGTDYVSIVEEGEFDDTPGVTIGKKFNDWRVCDQGTNWEHLELDGRNYVLFVCNILNSKGQDAMTLIGNVMSLGEEKAEIIADNVNGLLSAAGAEKKFTWDRYFMSLATTHNIKIQFEVFDDETFELLTPYAGQGKDFLVDISSQGSADDFVSVIFSNGILPIALLDTITTEFASYVPSNELSTEDDAIKWLEQYR